MLLVALLASADARATGCPQQTFIELGGSETNLGVSQPSTNVLCQRVAFDRAGVPYVLWAGNETGAFEVYLRRFVDGGWEGLGHSGEDGGLSLRAGGGSGRPSCWGRLAFDSTNAPIAAWSQSLNGRLVPYLQRWNGTNWVELGGSASTNGLAVGGSTNAFWPMLGVGESDQVTVVWTQATSAYARRWDGTGWEPLGGSASGTGLSGTGSVAQAISAFGRNGEVAVTWADLVTTPRTVRLLAWNGGSWGEWAGSFTQGLGAGDQPAALYDNVDRLMVAWDAPEDGGARTVESARWDGVTWQTLPPVPGIRATLARDTREHVLMVTQVALDGGSGLALYASTQTGWETCALNGITTQHASWPEVTIGPGDSVALGWFEGTSGQLSAHSAFVISSEPPPDSGMPPDSAQPPGPRRDLAVGCACGSLWTFSPAALLLVVLRAGVHRRRGRSVTPLIER